MSDTKRAALYLRVSTDKQTTDNQRRELEAAAAQRGWTVVGEPYADNGISGGKGRDKRPGLDRMLKDAVRGRFDVIMAWSVDRMGRSLADLATNLNELRSINIDLVLLQQGVDTTTPSGRAMFGMAAVFAEFEREMIVARVNAGLARARVSGTKSGKAIGRPKASNRTEREIRALLADGMGIGKITRQLGVGASTVARVRAEMKGEETA